MTKVAQVMTADPVAVGEQTSFKRLAEVLIGHRITAVPVIDADDRVVGLVSDADLMLKESEPDAPVEGYPFEAPRRRRERRKSVATTAGELMTKPPITISPQHTVEEAARLMRRHRVRRMPVVAPVTSELRGMVTRSDLLKVYLQADQGIERKISNELLPRSLGMDPRRFTVQVADGVVTIIGEVAHEALIPGVVQALQHVEGVVHVDAQLTSPEHELFRR